MKKLDFDLLINCANQCKLEIVGAFNLSDFRENVFLSKERLKHWQNLGYYADMSYMSKDAEAFLDFESYLPGSKSIISFFVSYNWKVDSVNLKKRFGYGRIAKYAWFRDYHRVLKSRLNNFITHVANHLGKFKYRLFVDAAPILERALAAQAGIGVVGKNTLIIRPGLGSYGFLCEVISDFEINSIPAEQIKLKQEQACKSCTRCLDFCPTKAIVEPYLLNSARCISYLTIEKKTSFNEWEREVLGNWLFGCDECQEVCPYNHNGIFSEPAPDDFSKRLIGQYLSLTEIIDIRLKKDFLNRFQGTPLMRAGRECMIRNACAIVGNQMYFESIPSLRMALQKDESILVKEEAKIALFRLKKNATGIDLMRINSCL